MDSNVLIDIMTGDPLWSAWSTAQAEQAAWRGPIFINDIVYAECSIRFERIEDFDAALVFAGVTIKAIKPAALFLAGKAFARYRHAGGPRSGVLPDFFIGAHAEFEGVSLLTRDTKRYRTYFPSVMLIAPDDT